MFNSVSPEANAGLIAALFFLWFALSIVDRIAMRKPIFAKRQPGDLFVERWTSGRSGSGLIGRLSSARNCLQLRVDQPSSRIQPHVPFTLGFVPEVYGMDHIAPLSSVRSARVLGGADARAVEVAYALPNGQPQVLQLLLKNTEAFIKAVGTPNWKP